MIAPDQSNIGGKLGLGWSLAAPIVKGRTLITAQRSITRATRTRLWRALVAITTVLWMGRALAATPKGRKPGVAEGLFGLTVGLVMPISALTDLPRLRTGLFRDRPIGLVGECPERQRGRTVNPLA